MRTRDIWNVCLQVYRNIRIGQKVAYVLRKIQTSRVGNLRIFRINNAKFQGIVFMWTGTNSEILKYTLVYL